MSSLFFKGLQKIQKQKQPDILPFVNLFNDQKEANKTIHKISGKLCPVVINIPYIQCDKQQHQGQPLSMVCIDLQCSKKTLICSICENQSHFGHNTVPLKVYLNQVFGHLYTAVNQPQVSFKNIMEENINDIQEFRKNKKNKKEKKEKNKNKSKKIWQNIKIKKAQSQQQRCNTLFYCNKINQLKQAYINSIRQYKQNIIDKLHRLQTCGVKYYNNLQQQMKTSISIQNSIQIINRISTKINENQNNQQYNETNRKQIKKLKIYVQNVLKSTNMQQKFVLNDRLSQIIQNCTKLNTTIFENILKTNKIYQQTIDKQIQKISSKLQKSIQFSHSYSKLQFAFSQKYKGHKMVLSKQNKVGQQTGMQSSGQRFMLIQPSLKKLDFKNKISVQTWGIKIIKLVGWIGLGIALKNSIIKANFNFHYTNIGHGSYLISSNGYSWSHSVKQFNSAFKTFTYTTNDIIYIQYDILNKKLKFVKNNNQKSFQLNIIDAPFDDQYCPCVNICSAGDTVEIINAVANIDFDKK